MKQNTQKIDSPQIIHISTLFWGLVPNLNSLSGQTILNSRHVSQRTFTKTIEGFIDFHSLRIKCLTCTITTLDRRIFYFLVIMMYLGKFLQKQRFSFILRYRVILRHPLPHDQCI